MWSVFFARRFPNFFLHQSLSSCLMIITCEKQQQTAGNKKKFSYYIFSNRISGRWYIYIMECNKAVENFSLSFLWDKIFHLLSLKIIIIKLKPELLLIVEWINNNNNKKMWSIFFFFSTFARWFCIIGSSSKDKRKKKQIRKSRSFIYDEIWKNTNQPNKHQRL